LPVQTNSTRIGRSEAFIRVQVLDVAGGEEHDVVGDGRDPVSIQVVRW
jgi:hypothetical protein